VVEWQADPGNWIPVVGWQGAPDASGNLLWALAEAQLGDQGIYRWVVYDHPGGVPWAVSAVFNLPSSPNARVAVSAAPLLTASAATPSGVDNPAAAATPSPLDSQWKTRASDPIAPGTYIVQPGDTLFRIARNSGLPWSALMQANHLPDTIIHPGQVLVIPGN
jgi:LysM repeat protein